jgi:predicted AlkP superfamily phosphohydrolase/phosphomutase
MVSPRIFIIGLDAATWDVLKKWSEAGDCCNIAGLIRKSANGPLQSSIPPLTPPAWTSFMTGCNPGRHGIYNFMEPREGEYGMRYSNAGSRKARTLWRVLNDAGHSTGVVNVPFTYPPEPLDGFQVSGMDTPSEKSAFVHPPELREELEREIGKLNLEIRYLGAMSTNGRRDAVLEGMRKLDEQWTRVALHALEKHPCEVMMVTFMSIDTVQHYFWHHMDERHFLHDPALAGRYRDAIKDVYRRLDESVGRILKMLPEDCTVLVVSDHGGGPVSDRTVYLNRYLQELGLLAYRQDLAGGLMARVTRGIYEAVRGALGSDQKKWLASTFPVLRERMENAATSFANIDWARTKAYCSEVLAYPPSVFLNMKGERPEGIVTESEREELLRSLTDKLLELKDPRDGSAIIPRIYRREEVFQGECAAQGPDLVLDWWSGAGFSASASLAEETGQPVLKIRDRAPMKEPEWSGTHRLHGILIGSGPAIQPGAQVEGARLMDMMPTILYLMDVPIPAGLDGRVLTEMVRPEHLREHPVRQEGGAFEAAPAVPNTPYSAEEAAEVEERLKALGYVD